MLSRSMFPVWSEPGLPRYFLGQCFSVLGFWTQATALNLHAWNLTSSASTLGQLNFLLFAPVFFISPLAGAALGMRTVHRAAFLICAGSAVVALVLGLLAVGGWLTVPVLMVAAVFSGTLNACELPTRQVLVSSAVSRTDLVPSAFATTSCLYNVGRMTGPALAGLLLPAVGVAWCFVVAVIGAGVMAYGVAGLRLADCGSDKVERGGRMRAGIRLIISTKSSRFLLALLALTSILATGYQTLIPAMAALMFGEGARFSGLLFSMVAAGALTAGLALSTRHASCLLERALLIAPWVAGVSTLALGFSHEVGSTVFLLWVLGGALALYASGANAKLLQTSPPELRGAVAGICMMLFLGMMPVSQLLAGYLAGLVGIANTLVFMGAALLAGVFACNVWLAGPQLVTLRLTRIDTRQPCTPPPQ